MTADLAWHWWASIKDTCTRDRTVPVDWMCECGFPKLGVKSLDLHIQEKCPPGAMMSWAVRDGLVLVRRDLAEVLLGFCDGKEGAIGGVFSKGGRVDDWCVLRHRRLRIVRGTRNARVRRCEVCGRQFYYAEGRRYLVGGGGSGWFANSARSGVLVTSQADAALKARFPDVPRGMTSSLQLEPQGLDGRQDVDDEVMLW